ncbi:LOW QUALITY PROTEIN: G patch domain-containing protein 3-like [Dendronephthya gigantea]|uniref:LOW QUALITY PROTEIN: G patch domain-containing protein 3-like n=1 Tax=Dendronephthya gigantea TaxID=151771 RepID=UPI00106D8C6A|nr:LOW QUALITY PROTEIN: G patch domain-containing protein 3-like [Dendronephthya gigantea]
MADESFANSEFSYVLVGNIPSKFHSVDLRSFFSQFIESGKFDCFHFRHRPEVLKRKNENGDNFLDATLESIKGKTTCCVVRLKEENLRELLQVYDGENWTDRHGKLGSQKAVISRITIKSSEGSSDIYKTRKETRNHKREKVEFDMEDLIKLSEFHPPSFMPNGNVGTTLTSFMSLIRSCQLPPHIIKKLGLSFPSGRSKRCYGNVRFDYANNANKSRFSRKKGKLKETLNSKRALNQCNSLGPLLENSNEVINQSSLSDATYTENKQSNVTRTISISSLENVADEQSTSCNENEPLSDTDSEPEEDWERHEALHDDVDSQGRTKERLFENKIELKWEKGGSGLVFYTDAAYWDSLSGDFDEQTADDWDIDMGIYEKEGYGDRHAKALMDIRHAEQRDLEADHNVDIGSFEKHTKGFGSKLMKEQGWTKGSSLGSSQGITEPIPNELPHCKTGLGYYGEKLERHVKRPRVDKEVVISTVLS